MLKASKKYKNKIIVPEKPKPTNDYDKMYELHAKYVIKIDEDKFKKLQERYNE